MKEFKTGRFLVQGFEGSYPEVGPYVRYFVSKLVSDRGMSNLNPDAHIGCFEATESAEYDNANVFMVDLCPDMIGEIMVGYQQFMNMPVFLWNGNNELTDDCRNELLAVGAKFCRDDEHETRWFAEEDNFVYQLGAHAKK